MGPVEVCHEDAMKMQLGALCLFVSSVLISFTYGTLGTFLFLFDARKFRVKDPPATF